LPPPRVFTAARYQIRTTADGQLPMNADLMRVIDEGIPGTAMPGWKTRLSGGDRSAVMEHIKSFSAFFADTTQRPEPLAFGRAPGGGGSEAALATGRQFYDSIGCAKCHGDLGRGDGPSAPTLEDDVGVPMFAADLSQNWLFNGGGTVEDIYHRLRTGLNGTPMPTFSDLIEQQFLTEEQLWRLAQYVRSLSPERPPERGEVIRASMGPLPAAPDDSAWAEVALYWLPLVGQIIRKPRWFTPAVSGIWVQAAHDGTTLALRLTWHDRSQSPDTAWLEFAGKVLAAVAGDDSVPPAPPAAGPWPDQVVVQFPRRIPSGMERPYFLMGTATDPVYQWRWTSAPGGAVAGVARGLERFDSLPGPRVAAQATYDRGEWRVVLTRALATADTAHELVFETGRAIPLAVFAWDGSNGETGARAAVSSWYFLALARPTPLGVY
ncbi:MAG: ethylbenzene dehydrogenase-related protein, partial [Acidimicrobiales bacterium]